MNLLEPGTTPNRRVLIIDDNPSIHEDFRKVLGSSPNAKLDELADDEAALFGCEPLKSAGVQFELTSAFQGKEGLETVRAAALAGEPFAMAFVDVRMPPGWDGIETISRIWKEFPELQVVVCTAYSDYSWDDMSRTLGESDSVLILKKPFDSVEVLQMAHALSKKWELGLIARRQMDDLDALVNQRTAELRDANVKLTGEVADRTAAEAALRRSEERFSKAFHGSPVPMAIRRPDGSGYLDANASFVALLDAPREVALAEAGALWTEPGTDGEISAELAGRHALRDRAASIRTHNGETREVLIAAQILELGDAPYHLLILQDVTDRTRLEEELRQAQKMEAVGRLAAGVAHDFNNILTVILGNTSLQLQNPRLDEKLADALTQVVRAGERATALTRQLLAYSRKQILLRRPIQLNEIVEQTIGMLRRVIGEHIALEMQLAPELPPIFADASNVDQVIMNLALNARDAMPEGGRLTFSTSIVEIDEADRARHAEAQPGSYICLSVKDSGHGMDAATQRRIFEPFFTTKDPGKGTGMGLATVYGVLKQHDGWIEVESESGHGTDIRAFFPVSKNGVAETHTEALIPPARSAPQEGRTILVAEDEEMLREFVSEALSSFGYRVLTAENGRRALEIWAAHRDEIDLLLTDVVMPESISGLQLAHQLTTERPGLKVIFTSGYSAELLGPDFEQGREYGFLSKPYLTDSLARTVAAHLSIPVAAA